MGSREVAGPTRCAKTPSGIERADSVPATQCTRVGSDGATDRASVVFRLPHRRKARCHNRPVADQSRANEAELTLAADDRPGLCLHE